MEADSKVRLVASHLVARHGMHAPKFARDKAAHSHEHGDHAVGDVWRRIGEAALELLDAPPGAPH